jgi:Uma2 family endonuclease
MGAIQTVTDYLHPAMAAWKKLPEEIRAEVINEQLYILPPPSLYHGQVIMAISIALTNYVIARKLGIVFNCGVGVYLKREMNAVIPDILFVAARNRLVSIEEKGVVGPPDLVFEILSPGNRSHDRVRKRKLYEQAGVKEYWIVDPQTKDTQGYLLKGKKYDEPLLMNSEISIRILKKKITF